LKKESIKRLGQGQLSLAKGGTDMTYNEDCTGFLVEIPTIMFTDTEDVVCCFAP